MVDRDNLHMARDWIEQAGHLIESVIVNQRNYIDSYIDSAEGSNFSLDSMPERNSTLHKLDELEDLNSRLRNLSAHFKTLVDSLTLHGY